MSTNSVPRCATLYDIFAVVSTLQYTFRMHGTKRASPFKGSITPKVALNLYRKSGIYMLSLISLSFFATSPSWEAHAKFTRPWNDLSCSWHGIPRRSHQIWPLTCKVKICGQTLSTNGRKRIHKYCRTHGRPIWRTPKRGQLERSGPWMHVSPSIMCKTDQSGEHKTGIADSNLQLGISKQAAGIYHLHLKPFKTLTSQRASQT